MTNQIIITSKQNSLVKQVRKLHRSKERKKHNLLLLEGNNLVFAAINTGYGISHLFCTVKWQNRHQQLWQKVINHKIAVTLISEDVLDSISTTVSPDGVLAIVSRQPVSMPKLGNMTLGLIVERLQDPGNLGTIIRTSVATKVDALWLSQDSVDFEHPKVLRASVGEWFNLPMQATPDLEQVILQAKQQGIQTIATIPHSAQTYWDLDLTKPSLLLIGNEGKGLSPQLQSLADVQIHIPLANQVESLNAAIATSLILYEATRQRNLNYPKIC